MELVLDQHAALGTAWWVEANLSGAHQGEHLRTLLVAHLNQFEGRYSRFRTDSLVGRLNHERVLYAPDADLQEILRFGQSLYERTAGTFNFLLGDVLTARGYGKGRQDAVSDDTTPHPRIDLSISPEHIRLERGSVDLGGFGKGYVIDELASILRREGVTDFLINGGGDLYGTSDDGKPITIFLEHPTAPGIYLGTTGLYHQGFAASSPYKRVWKHGDTEHSHIVGDTEFATYVVAKSAALADAFATAALLLPEDTLMTCANSESFGFARFSPQTSTLSQYQFDITHL